MRVQLLSHTPDALEVLLFTRETRLSGSPEGRMEEIKGWSQGRKMEELQRALKTIQSSWEFVDYIFSITGVTRAFTHQLVRHRAGTAFAQQAQRAVGMENFSTMIPPSVMASEAAREEWNNTMFHINEGYMELQERGIPKQDARGVLPTNILTNITFKANLRTLHDMGLKRLCVRAQGEFQEVFRAIRQAVVEVHPWVNLMIGAQCWWDGTCIFPLIPTTDCPVKPFVYNPETAASYGSEMVRPLPVLALRHMMPNGGPGDQVIEPQPELNLTRNDDHE